MMPCRRASLDGILAFFRRPGHEDRELSLLVPWARGSSRLRGKGKVEKRAIRRRPLRLDP